MSDKALLVMDMPESCGKCPLRSLSDDCEVVGRHVRDCSHLKNKPDWCPLKPMPEKKNYEALSDKNPCKAWGNGWNACIDEILEGCNEKS